MRPIRIALANGAEVFCKYCPLPLATNSLYISDTRCFLGAGMLATMMIVCSAPCLRNPAAMVMQKWRTDRTEGEMQVSNLLCCWI
jgi:hypothetical protein